MEIGLKEADKLNKYIKNPKHMLIYHGSPGCGKTYFCASLIEWALEKFNHFRYYSERDILSKLRQGISEGEDYARNLELLIDDDLIILDDVGSSINPEKYTVKDLEWRREIFFNFLDYRYNCQKPTIITSNFRRAQFIEVYSERIFSRLFADENTVISMWGEHFDKRRNSEKNNEN